MPGQKPGWLLLTGIPDPQTVAVPQIEVPGADPEALGRTPRPPKEQDQSCYDLMMCPGRGPQFPQVDEEELDPETPMPSSQLSRESVTSRRSPGTPGGRDTAGTVISPGSGSGSETARRSTQALGL